MIYDAIGQVTSGKKFLGDGSPISGQQFEYAFDDIGNRRTNWFGGDSDGASLRAVSYTANGLNQYTERRVPGSIHSVGSAHPDAQVTVFADEGSSAPTDRKDDYFHGELLVNNSIMDWWGQVTAVAVRDFGTNAEMVADYQGARFVPQTQESYAYDEDGNLRSDGRWQYSWDAENRLIRMESLAGGPVNSKRKLEVAYDSQGRRIKSDHHVYNPSTGLYELTSTTKYLYDGWNLLAELDGANNLVRSYMWGLDLSGSIQGAGGVGGLLAVNTASQGAHFCAYDGNGNVAGLVSADDGTISAIYECGP